MVIPLYNKASRIQRALDSVLNQDIKDFECIVIIDGSTDGSEEIVKLYIDKSIHKKLESIIIRYINSNQKIKACSILASNK